MPGPLALVGGDEFRPGNERQDEFLRDSRGRGPAYVIATAARDNPSAAVATARRWFAGLGLDVVELRVRDRQEAESELAVRQAEGAGFFYLAGGDPGWLVGVLRG